MLIWVDPVALNQAFHHWNARFGVVDESMAIDGKTLCNALDEAGRQTHNMSAVGHQSTQCYTQKKWAPYPTLMVVILFLGGIQLMAIGVIGEYLGRMFDESKGRPLYILFRNTHHLQTNVKTM